jgi:branched-chain amino acid aminotransferase
MSFINFNGKIIEAKTAVFGAANRLRFGDGFFESMRMFHSKVAFMEEHFERIIQSVHLLKMQLPNAWNKAFFNQEILKLAEANQFRFARIRIQFYREGEGRYLPTENHCGFVIDMENDGVEFYSLHTLKAVDVSVQFSKPAHKMGNMKSSSALMYVLASIEAKERALDEMILLNTDGNICEALASNFFMVKNRVVYTPPLQSGCVDGVMRKKAIEILLTNHVQVHQRNCNISDIENASELFLTNASKGIQHIEMFGKKAFATSDVATLLADKLNSLVVQ